mgnify:CR=1 FL=1
MARAKVLPRQAFRPPKGAFLSRQEVDAIVRALKEINFSGCWMLDLYLYPLPVWGSREGLESMRKTLASHW